MTTEQPTVAMRSYFSIVDDELSGEDNFIDQAILRLMEREGSWISTNHIMRSLEIGGDGIDSRLDKLKGLELVRSGSKESERYQDGQEYLLTDDGKKYLRHRFDKDFGHLSSSWKGLSRDELKSILTSASPYLEPYIFEKKMDIPLSTLQGIGKKVEEDYTKLRMRERELLVSALNLPKGSSVDVSFLTWNNATFVEGVGYRDPHFVTARVNYSTIDEALEDCNSISGYIHRPNLSEMFPGKELRLMTSLGSISAYVDFHEGVRTGLWTASLNYFLGDVFSLPIVVQKYLIERDNELLNSVSSLYKEKQKSV